MAMGQAEGASLRWLPHGAMEGGMEGGGMYFLPGKVLPAPCPLRNLFFDAAADESNAFEWFQSGSRPVLFPFPFGPSF